MANTPVLLGSGAITLLGPQPIVVTGSSTAAGFIAPISAPIYDDPLDDFLHTFLRVLSGIPGQFVRPRWQPEPPNLPAFTQNWLAWGITELEEDRFAYQGQSAESATVERDELLTMLISYYGPAATQIAKQVSASIQLGQNRAYLQDQSMTVIEVYGAIRIPALLKEKWVPRVDQRVRFRRRATWAYNIKTIQSAQAILDNEQYSTPLVVTNPPTP